MAIPLGLFFLYETIKTAQTKNFIPLLITINFGLLELILLLLQFYGYDSATASSTPTFNSLYEGLTRAFYPLPVALFSLLMLSALFYFIKSKSYPAILFLCLSAALQLTLYISIYQGVIHQHHFFYISLIASYWLGLATSKKYPPKFYLLPLLIISISQIFNPYSAYKIRDKIYLNNLKESALSLNRLYANQPAKVILFEQFDANIIRPYLNENITLLNQQMTDFTSFKSFKDFLIWFQKPINPKDIAQYIQKSPQTPIFRACGEQYYYNTNLTFSLKYRLNQAYCLYEIKVN